MIAKVAGVGMVSPAGMTPSDHVFFLRAGLFVPPPSPFETGEGERVDVLYCPWIGARVGVAERLHRMARIAVHEALSPLAGAIEAREMALLIVLPAERPGLSMLDAEALVRGLTRELGPRRTERFAGDAGGFAAIARAGELLRANEAHAALVVALDTSVCKEGIAHHRATLPSFWSMDVPDPSEGAAAVLLVGDAQSHVARFGRVHGVALAKSAANDANDTPADGGAAASVIRALHGGHPHAVGLAIGQERVDDLRAREWNYGHMRSLAHLPRELESRTIERHIGRVGAAAGVFNVAYGVALAQHRAHAIDTSNHAPFVAWAMSPDGTLGAALVEAR